MDKKSGEALTEFEWIKLRSDMANINLPETSKDKFFRKFKDNPFVPIGCFATVAALSMGLWSFRHGKHQMSQNMMRLRIAAQGFTVSALIIGVVIAATKKD